VVENCCQIKYITLVCRRQFISFLISVFVWKSICCFSSYGVAVVFISPSSWNLWSPKFCFSAEDNINRSATDFRWRNHSNLFITKLYVM